MAPKIRHLILAAAAAAAATPAAAQRFQDIDDLEQRVIAALGANIGEPGGPVRPVDRRLRLAQCPAALVVAEPALGAVAVRCEPLGWRIRVPLMRGDQNAEAAPAPSPAAARPQRAARGQAVVRRGDPVALIVTSGSFTVSRQAVAEQDGAPGDRIRVRAEGRGASIIGQVLADGRVALTGFN
jgi:flagella basal body P-ring formation protein FlgA